MSINRDLYLQQKGVKTENKTEYPSLSQLTSLVDRIKDAFKFYLDLNIKLDTGDLLTKLTKLSVVEYKTCSGILFSMEKGKDNKLKMKQVINIINK